MNIDLSEMENQQISIENKINSLEKEIDNSKMQIKLSEQILNFENKIKDFSEFFDTVIKVSEHFEISSEFLSSFVQLYNKFKVSINTTSEVNNDHSDIDDDDSFFLIKDNKDLSNKTSLLDNGNDLRIIEEDIIQRA